MKKYHEIIRELREDHDLSQKEMGKILGISQNTVSQYEKGIRTLPIDLLKIYANYFDVSADYILGIEKQSVQKSNNNKSIIINGNKNNISNIKIK